MLVVASCSNDTPVAPLQLVKPNVGNNPALRALATPSYVDFVIPAAGGTVTLLGVHTLDFPANSVCDPNAADTQAGYAAKDWDAPCTVATEDVIVRATLKWSYGRLWADFSPSIRFAPDKNVQISTTVFAPLVQFYAQNQPHDLNDMARNWGFGYINGIEQSIFDDTKGDPSVRTYIDLGTGRIYRRIKHFSGYMIATGEECELSPDNPYCVPYENPPVVRN